MIEIDELRDVGQVREARLEGPPCNSSSVGRSRMCGPSGTNFAPSTSKNSRAPLTVTCMPVFPLCRRHRINTAQSGKTHLLSG
jgi:hypothetical protein